MGCRRLTNLFSPSQVGSAIEAIENYNLRDWKSPWLRILRILPARGPICVSRSRKRPPRFDRRRWRNMSPRATPAR
ncbi:hypothetical protein MES4922_490026 [Mesorhizobium ventifaucium]|uniref:Uncharacterized protein n=1 Tax=Mesorhizobium ventifaucium TaxID=666020 RepID=A0ABN8K7M5_9HYPH|nr:hypothetical protein MES4922_490026 [Mesorhizobium ventifaucium]